MNIPEYRSLTKLYDLGIHYCRTRSHNSDGKYLTNENVPMGIDHVFDMRQTVSAARVMRGPVGGLGGTLPVVVSLQIGRTFGIVEMRTEIFRRFLS